MRLQPVKANAKLDGKLPVEISKPLNWRRLSQKEILPLVDPNASAISLAVFDRRHGFVMAAFPVADYGPPRPSATLI